jgi:hypothetical protein
MKRVLSRSSTQSLKAMVIWTFEMLSSATGTCIIFTAMVFLQSGEVTPPLNNDLTLLRAVGLTLMILFYFGVTGFLITTLIARLAMRGKSERFYPYVCAGLYLIHSTMFFVANGNSPFRISDLTLQLAGSCLMFACTWIGNRLIGNWTKIPRASR